MLTHPTLDQLKAFKLDGMADAFVELQSQGQAADLAHAEWLALLLDREAANRNTRRFQIRLRSAKLRHGQAAIEDVDYRTPRRLDKALFQQLTAGKWIAEHRNLLVTGPCGVGKSWLSCALAQKACRDGYTVLYARVPRLFADLELAHGDGRFTRLFRTLVKADSVDPRRLGPGPAHRQPAARSDGDRRGPLRPRLDAHHQPTPPRQVARCRRRADFRRRHPRSHRPQRLSAGIGRAVHAQAQSQRTGRTRGSSHPQNKAASSSSAPSPSRQKETRNDRRAQLPARPGGSTGTSRARRCVSREGTPRRARVPPIDYRDGLSPCLTSNEETDITTIIQRRPQHPRRTLVAINRNSWSRSVGMSGRDRRNAQSASAVISAYEPQLLGRDLETLG